MTWLAKHKVAVIAVVIVVYFLLRAKKVPAKERETMVTISDIDEGFFEGPDINPTSGEYFGPEADSSGWFW